MFYLLILNQTPFFFDPHNPIILSLVVLFVIILLLVIFIKYIFVPLKIQHLKDKQNFELKNTRLMALFAELDPDPVFRLDRSGKVIHHNESAGKMISENVLGQNWDILFPSVKINFPDFISNNESVNSNVGIEDKYYSLFIHGISYLEIAQVYFRDITERVKSEEQSKMYQAELKKLAFHLENKLESERQRISRELHDGVGQMLLFLKLKMQKFGSGSEENSDEFGILDDLLNKSINELKDISYNLKPKILDEMGLVPAISSLIEKVTEQSGIKGSVSGDNLQVRFEQTLETALFRTAQESFNNIMKHSRATEFNLHITRRKNILRMIISDNGIGMEKAKEMKSNYPSSGMGLLNMKERVANFNGTVKFDSSADSGTIVFIEIPEIEKYEE